MATFYIQLENKLLQISGELTAENISKALGYVPVDSSTLNNYATKDEVSDLVDMSMVEDLSQRVDNITFDSLKDNPFLQDGSGELNIVDEAGNIIAKIDAEGIHSVDFIAGNHKLTDKIDSSALNGYAKESWVTAEITKAATEGKVDLTGYATEEWVANQNYLTEHQDISHLATKDEVSNIDFYNIKDNPIVNNGDGKLLFVDENGYIGLQLEEDGLYVKDVIADGHTLSQKADKSELSNYATKDEVSDLVDMSVVTELQGKVETLVGEDTDKSVRDIAVDVLTETLVSETATEAYDTLAEMSAWIKSHPEDAAAMNTVIQKNAEDITNLDTAYKAADTKVLTDAQEYTDNINFYTIKDNPIVDGEAGSITFVDETGYIGLKVTEDGIIAKDVVTPEHTLSSKADKSFVEDNYYNKSTVDKKITEAVTGGQVSLDGFATEQWVNEQGFLKEHQNISHLAEKSELPTKTSDLTNDSGFITINDVPEVTVPTKVSELENDSKFITIDDVPEVTVPTKTSELTNDSGFITINDVPVLEIPEEYITETELSQKGFLVGEEGSDELDDVETNTYVKYVAQTLTDEQKEQVRNNIDAIGNNSNTFVSYAQQTLTEEQQKQARLNIGLSEISSINYDLNVKAINHRGYSYEAPENTIPAYIMSKHKGFTYVEGDVSFTEDNVAVLLHDATIDRTSDGSGNITTLKYQEVLQYDFGSWFSEEYKGVKIPTFIEWITLCKNLGLHPYIELKSAGGYTQDQITQIVNEVEKCGMKGKVTYISFSDKFLGWVKTADPYARLGFLTSTFNTTYINKGVALKTTTNDVFMDVKLASVTESGINTCISKGLPLEVWTVNEESEILSMPAYVNGVTSDYLIAGKVLYENSLIYTPPTSNWVPTTSISLDKTSILFETFDSISLIAIVEPSNSTEEIVWKSSNNAIAVVNNGVVTPLSDGSCTITVTSGKYSASCTTTVAFARFNITSNLVGCQLDSSINNVIIGTSWSGEVTPNEGYSLKNASIQITMGGADITDTAYSNGIITIEKVTGEVAINITCVEVPVYSITRNLVGCTSNKDTVSIGEGNPYNEVFTAMEDYRLNGASVSITMGGWQIESTYYSDGVLSIPEVTGDIVININAEVIPVYSITRNLVNCSTDSSVTTIKEGESHNENILSNEGYTLRGGNIVITMGGVDISSSLSNTGILSINAVTGNIVINVEAVEYNSALPIVDLGLDNVGTDGVIRNLGTGGSTYDATIQTTSTSDTFSVVSGTGLTLKNHAYANVPYVLKGTDNFTIICKGKIATKSSQTYQRFFRTDTDAPSWYYSKSNTKLQAKLSGKNSSESTISMLGSLIAGVTGTDNSGNSVIFNTDTTTVREIMFTCDGTDIKLYIDGKLSASQPATGLTETAYIGIGDNNPSSKYYASALEINRFAIYDSVITDDIITDTPVNIRLTNENLSLGAINSKNQASGSYELISPYRTNMTTRAATAADLSILVNGGKTVSIEAKDKNGSAMQVGIQTFGDDALEALSNGESIYPYIIDSGWITSGNNYQIPITHKYAWIVVSYSNTSTAVDVNNIDYIQITEVNS